VRIEGESRSNSKRKDKDKAIWPPGKKSGRNKDKGKRFTTAITEKTQRARRKATATAAAAAMEESRREPPEFKGGDGMERDITSGETGILEFESKTSGR
jgi:hypothetical protein